MPAVRVEAAAPTADRVPRVAAWLVAWLAGQLGWEAIRREESSGRIEATFRGPTGEVAVSLRVEAAPDLPLARVRRVELTSPGPDGEESFESLSNRPHLRRDPHRHLLAGPLRLPRLVHSPEFDPAHRVAAALESSRLDPPYRHALPHLLWLLGA